MTEPRKAPERLPVDFVELRALVEKAYERKVLLAQQAAREADPSTGKAKSQPRPRPE